MVNEKDRLDKILERLARIESYLAPAPRITSTISITSSSIPAVGSGDGGESVFMGNGYICHFRIEPDDTECRAMLWSDGRDCKMCPCKCYRAGWDKETVLADNEQRVAAKQLAWKIAQSRRDEAKRK